MALDITEKGLALLVNKLKNCACSLCGLLQEVLLVAAREMIRIRCELLRNRGLEIRKGLSDLGNPRREIITGFLKAL